MLRPYSIQACIAVALTTGLLPAPARASALPQDTTATAILVMQVDIWPEYDDPRVLVILKGLLDLELDVPRDFSFIVPQGADLGMVGGIGEGGQHMMALAETRPYSEGLQEVAYTLEQKTFYMEFYYDPLGDDDEREFQYPIVSSYPIATVFVNVQQPLEAQAFRTRPAAATLSTDDRGFTYHQLGFDSLPADSTQWVTVAYEKSDREPSVRAAGTGTPTGGNAMRSMLIIVAILLVGAVGYGIFAGSAKRVTPVTTMADGSWPSPAGPDRKFCTSCGTQMRRAAAYCAECGARAPT